MRSMRLRLRHEAQGAEYEAKTVRHEAQGAEYEAKTTKQKSHVH